MNQQQFQAATGLSNDLAGRWYAAVSQAMMESGIAAPVAQAMFIAQTGHESVGFSQVVESFNYTPDALLRTFGKHFTPVQAQSYGRTPVHPADQAGIANRVYANRMGNTAPDDGWRYRGRGLMQVTGRRNYAACSQALAADLLLTPQLLEEPDYAARSAAWFWQVSGCNDVAGDINAVTRRINGGLNGLEDRTVRFERAKSVLGV